MLWCPGFGRVFPDHLINQLCPHLHLWVNFFFGCPSISALQMSSRRKTFKATQIIVPLLPVPLGCWFLYKALKSFNRNPPPIATDSATVLQRPLYAEPVYQVCARLY